MNKHIIENGIQLSLGASNITRFSAKRNETRTIQVNLQTREAIIRAKKE